MRISKLGYLAKYGPVEWMKRKWTADDWSQIDIKNI